jgi:glycosyltransferase involved in cell wall biosynthesis
MIDDLESHGVADLALWERAVDAGRFRPDARSESMRSRLSGGKPEQPLLLYVGRLSAEKEVTRLKELFPALPGMRLAIVGDGPMRRELERHFQGTDTVFTGYLQGEELVEAYASADLFVLPSKTETLGLVLLEAMAAGCPVVACRAGGVPDAIEHGVTGFLFDPDNAESFASTVKQAYRSGAGAESIRVNARRDVERHGWATATARLRLLYEKAAREGARKGIQVQTPMPKRIAAGIALGTLRTLLP